jgi:hypothetical protein
MGLIRVWLLFERPTGPQAVVSSLSIYRNRIQSTGVAVTEHPTLGSNPSGFCEFRTVLCERCAGGGIRTHEPLRDGVLSPTPLTRLGDPRALAPNRHELGLTVLRPHFRPCALQERRLGLSRKSEDSVCIKSNEIVLNTLDFPMR